jgi:hypothetical protein
VKNRFQSLPFKFNLRRYSTDDDSDPDNNFLPEEASEEEEEEEEGAVEAAVDDTPTFDDGSGQLPDWMDGRMMAGLRTLN